MMAPFIAQMHNARVCAVDRAWISSAVRYCAPILYCGFLADRANGRAYVKVLLPSICRL